MSEATCGVVVAVGTGLFLFWLVLLIALATSRPAGLRVTDALRLLPDVIVLLRRLASDPHVPRGVRVRLVLLMAYLLCPIDLVPDFIPVLGYADDAIIVAVALRSVSRRAGAQALERHWPGTPAGLRSVRRLAGIEDPPATGS